VKGVRHFDPAALRSLRHRRGLTLDELGRRIGRARPNLIVWEKGRSVPSPPKLVALAEALEVEPWQLTTARPRSAELVDLRAWAGLSQQELADRAAVPRATYALVERGESPLGHELAARLATVLGWRVADVDRAQRRTARRRKAPSDIKGHPPSPSA
jgi:transcriptional regulator with XRE-family HTH domain